MILHLPIAWIIGVGAKKIFLYQTAKAYGFSRIYRRIMEFTRNHYAKDDKELYNSVRKPVQAIFRAPSSTISILEKNTHLFFFFESFEKFLEKDAGFLGSVLLQFLRATTGFKWIKEAKPKQTSPVEISKLLKKNRPTSPPTKDL